MQAKKIIGRLLLAFVLVSIGYAIGREVEKGRAAARAAPARSEAGAGQDKVVVYYLHATFRCVTCNTVESLAEELVRTEFAEAVKAGRLEWRVADFQENGELADRYKVAGNMIVVARFRDGKEVESRRLDRVMELVNNRGEFLSYVRKAVRELLEDGA